MRVIVCGGRTFPDTFEARRAAGAALDAAVASLAEGWISIDKWMAHQEPAYLKRNPIVEGVISGGAKGVDSVAPAWAAANGRPFSVMPYAVGGEHCEHCLWPLAQLDGHPTCQHSQGDRRVWGKVRNRLMAQRLLRGDVPPKSCVVLAIWDGMTPGTAHMIATGVRLEMVVRTIEMADVLRGIGEWEEGEFV